MPPGVDIDRAIDRLDDALRHAGAAGLEEAREAEALTEIAAAVQPWAVPADLECLWRRVDTGELGLRVSAWRMPPFADARSALAAHDQMLDVRFEHLYGPPLLFPFAVDNHGRWSVELQNDATSGGMVFSQEDAIRVEYPSIAELLDTFAVLIEGGFFERAAEGRILLTDAEERSARDKWLGRAPAAGLRDEITIDPSGWPEHWLRSAGIDPEDRHPLGRTHTIAELVSAAAGGPVEGRIVGAVVRLVHLGDGALVLVDDGSSTIDVWCPAGTSPWGPSHGRRFEFAVRLERTPAPPPDFDSGPAEIQRHALAGSLDSAQVATAAFFDDLEARVPGALATGVRPVD